MINEKKLVKLTHKMNIIKIDDNTFAVLKYLLPPKYFPTANELSKQLFVQNLQYVLMSANEIADDVYDFIQPHVMDGYTYPMNGDCFPNYTQMTPYPQQIHTARFLVGNKGEGHEINGGRGAHLHSSMRVGKTLSTLWAIDFLLQQEIIKKVIVVCPTSVVKSTWAKELSRHFMHLTYTCKLKSARDKHSNSQIDIINWDGLTVLLEKGLIEEYDLIVYDEATALKTSNTNRWKALNKYLKSRPWCRLWLLTGTPLAQSPLAAYGPAKLVSPHLVPHTFTAWRTMTMFNTWGHEWKPKADAAQLCADALQPCLRFELKDISEIPDHVYEYIRCDKSMKQTKMFKQMAQEYIAEFSDDSHISAVNAASKMSKMLQILTGAVYTEDKQVLLIDTEPRLQALTDLIDQLPDDQPIVIFAEWRHTIHMLRDYLKPKYKTVEIIDGSTPNNDSPEGRLAIERRVQSKETKIVICHPATTAFGLDFSSTNVCVWYCVTFKNELYTQGSERIRNYASRSRGYDKFIIYHLISDDVEQLYFEALRDKLAMQQDFFNVVKNSLKSEFIV